MPNPSPGPAPRPHYADAVEALADRVLDALRGAGDPAVVARHVDAAADPKAALAAVRVLGPDVFTPDLLGGVPLDPADADAVAEAFRVFPPAPDAAPEVAQRDRAAVLLLARRGGGELPEVPAPADAARAGGPAGDPAADAPWPTWCAGMAQMSSLALPDLDGPVHARARSRQRDLARGTVRAMLRRDYPAATRLARWLALVGPGPRPGLDAAAVLRHAGLHGAHSARVALEAAVARCLLRRPGPREEPR